MPLQHRRATQWEQHVTPEDNRRPINSNDSTNTRCCLIWHKSTEAKQAASGDEGHQRPLPSVDPMPAHIPSQIAASRPIPRKRKLPNPCEEDEDLCSPRRHRGGLRSLETTRTLLARPDYLLAQQDDGPGDRPHSGKGRGVVWGWRQQDNFDLGHDVAGEVRSPLQVAQDARRSLEGRRRRAFLQHLQTEATYRAVNRIKLRGQAPLIGQRDKMVFPFEPATHQLLVGNVRPMPHPPLQDAPAPPPRTVLSARVKRRIVSMADSLLRHPPLSGGAGNCEG